MAGAPGVTVGGVTYRRPGVRSTLNGEALARGARSPAGVVTVLGIFERLQPTTPVEVTTPERIRELLPVLGGRISRLLFEASNDTKIRGRPSKVILVRVNPATRAVSTLNDANAAACMKLEAADWGVYGNQVSRKVENGTTVGKKYTFQEAAKPAAVVDDVELKLLSINQPDTTEHAAFALTVVPTPTTGYVRLAFTSIAFALNADPKTINLTKLAIDGILTLTLDQVSGAATQVTITGINKTTGAPDTETVVIGAATVSAPSAKQWSDISSVVLTNKGTATTLTLSGYSADLAITQYTKLSTVVAKLTTALAGKGVVVTALTGTDLAVTSWDSATSVSAHNLSTATAKADLYEGIRRINAEGKYVVASRPTGGTALPPANVSIGFLGGGGEGSTSNSDWLAALNRAKTVKTNIIVALTTSASIHADVKAHTRFMEGDGRNERNTYCGAAADETLAQLATRSIALNDRNVSLPAPEIKVYDDAGGEEWLTPEWFGLLVAGLQASRRVGVPLTDKAVNVLDFRTNTAWDGDRDAEAVIERSILTLYRHQDGTIRILKQLTTYQQREHPVFSMISCNESANESTKHFRETLEIYIGDPSTEVDADFLAQKGNEELERQTGSDVLEIDSFDPEATAFTKIANGFKGVASIRAVDSTEFIVIGMNLLPPEG